MTDDTTVSVEIYGLRYPIRTGLDPEYVARLARYVDDKMLAASEATPNSDALRLAVLVGLNLADELFRSREATRATSGALVERAGELEKLLDRLLMAS